MYTVKAIGNGYDEVIYNHKFENLEDAYEAADEMGLHFYSFVEDHNGLELDITDIIDRLYGVKHRIVMLYFKGFSSDFAKCHYWFRLRKDVEMFDTIDVVGKDGVTYHGTVVRVDTCDIYPPHMGKAIIA